MAVAAGPKGLQQEEDDEAGELCFVDEADLLVKELTEAQRLPAIPKIKSNTGLLRGRWGAQRQLLFGAASLGSMGLIVFAVSVATHRTGLVEPAPPPQQKFLPSCLTHGGVPACPAIGLLDREEVRRVASENLMAVGRQILGDTPEGTVSKVVANSFDAASKRLQRGAPSLSIALQMTQLTDVQKDSVLTCLQLLRNRRVQRLGLHVARAIRGSPSKEPTAVRMHIEHLLRPLLGEMRRLRDELIPIPVRQLWGQGHAWELTLDLENVHIMGVAPSGPFAQSGQAPSSDVRSLSLGLQIGAAEQSRVLLDLLRQSAQLPGKEHIPAWFTSVSQAAGPRDLSCELANVELNLKDPLKAWFCPLKFGGQGIDALRAVSGMTALPLPMNLFESVGELGTTFR